MDLSRLNASVYHFVEQTPFNFGFYHPYVVDFAIVLPLLALFFHFLSILSQSNDNSNKEFFKTGNFLFFSSIIAIFLAYLTGVSQSDDLVRETLSLEGKGIYDAHNTLGTYLFLSFLFLLILKIISLLVKKVAIRYIFGTLFFFMILMLIYQDFIGISLVYDYGAGVVSAK